MRPPVHFQAHRVPQPLLPFFSRPDPLNSFWILKHLSFLPQPAYDSPESVQYACSIRRASASPLTPTVRGPVGWGSDSRPLPLAPLPPQFEVQLGGVLSEQVFSVALPTQAAVEEAVHAKRALAGKRSKPASPARPACFARPAAPPAHTLPPSLPSGGAWLCRGAAQLLRAARGAAGPRPLWPSAAPAPSACACSRLPPLPAGTVFLLPCRLA